MSNHSERHYSISCSAEKRQEQPQWNWRSPFLGITSGERATDGNAQRRGHSFQISQNVAAFFWHLHFLEQMTQEVPGIRPAVISTETWTRLVGYRRLGHVVRNVYTHRFDPAKFGKLVNSASELFARIKAELLAFAAFLEH